MGKDGGGEGCRRKNRQEATRKKTFMSQISKVANFSWSNKWSLAHEYLKRELSACPPFTADISVPSLISHESIKRLTEWQEGST